MSDLVGFLILFKRWQAGQNNTMKIILRLRDKNLPIFVMKSQKYYFLGISENFFFMKKLFPLPLEIFAVLNLTFFPSRKIQSVGRTRTGIGTLGVSNFPFLYYQFNTGQRLPNSLLISKLPFIVSGLYCQSRECACGSKLKSSSQAATPPLGAAKA